MPGHGSDRRSRGGMKPHAQGRLFEVEPRTEGDARPCKPAPPLAASADPGTSFVAAEKIEASGRLGAHQLAVLAVLCANPDSTSGEIGQGVRFADAPEMDGGERRTEAARRLSDLRHLGLAVQGARRRCRVHGSSMVTWRATEAEK